MSNPEINENRIPKKRPENVNTSGKGPNAKVPEAVKNKFNWGAFLFFELWGFLNKKYLAIAGVLLMFIPLIGILINLGMRIYYGIKGNEWAWQNNYYPSINVFHETQQRWNYAFLFYFILFIVLVIVYISFSAVIFTSVFGGLGGLGGTSPALPPMSY